MAPSGCGFAPAPDSRRRERPALVDCRLRSHMIRARGQAIRVFPRNAMTTCPNCKRITGARSDAEARRNSLPFLSRCGWCAVPFAFTRRPHLIGTLRQMEPADALTATVG